MSSTAAVHSEGSRLASLYASGPVHFIMIVLFGLLLTLLSVNHAFAKETPSLLDQLTARVVAIKKAADQGNSSALDEALQRADNLYPVLQRELPPVERPQVGIGIGTACKQFAESTKNAAIAGKLRAAAFDYFRKGAETAESLGQSQAQYEALNGAIDVYNTINDVQFDGMRHYGSQQALTGLIPLFEATRQALEAINGPDDPSVGVLLMQLAHMRQATRLAESAIGDYERSFAIFRNTKAGKGQVPREMREAMAPYIWSSRLGLYELLMGRLQHDRAEEALQSLVPVFPEKSDPSDHVEVMNRIGMHFYYAGNGQQAIQYLEQAAAGAKRLRLRDAIRIATIEDNLAAAYLRVEDVEKAIAHNREANRVLMQDRARRSENADDIIKIQNNYAAMLRRKGDFDGALEVWASVLKQRGWPQDKDCLACGIQLFNISDTMLEANDKNPNPAFVTKALSYAQDSLDVNLRLVGREVAQTASAYELLARAAMASGNVHDAIRHTSEAISIYKDLFAKSGLDRIEYAKAARDAGLLKLKALWQSEDPQDVKLKASFETAQLINWTRLAEALAQSLERTESGNPQISDLLRSRQDLVQQRSELSGRLNAAIIADLSARTRASAAALKVAREALARVNTSLTDNARAISVLAPDLGEVDVPAVTSLEEIGAHLPTESALALFVTDTDATYMWVVGKTASRWTRIALGSATLADRVQALRCGLDPEEWDGIMRPTRCARLLGLTRRPAQNAPLPFDLGLAHELYTSLFGSVEELIQNQHLLVVPSGPLTSLPFQVLVTATPASSRPRRFEDYKNLAWLIRRQPITVLPSVSSLRDHTPTRPNIEDRLPYLGYGDPVLVGDGSCRPSILPKDCTMTSAHGPVRAVADVDIVSQRRAESRSGSLDRIYRRGASLDAVLAEVRGSRPLHDTAFELRCVAQSLSAPADALRLGISATETDIKQLSQQGQLARYRVVHFATHGLLAGDTELLATRQGEPALVLTPPDQPRNDDDDGLLTASEVARLRFDADWVILSACNTAAGDRIGSEALSGMARAFFYAGARSLLVSHWPVYSDAAAQLLDRTFTVLSSEPTTERSEAFRRAILALMSDSGEDDNSHPSVWGPMILVGLTRS